MSSGTEECKEAKPAIKPNLYEEGHPETWAPTFPLGEVQYRKTGFRKLPEGINDKRVTMTISHFENYADVALGYGGGDLEPWRKVGMIKGIVAFTFLHEFTHMDQPGLFTADPAYAWEKALLLSPAVALTNAETYTWFAFLIRCAEKRYRLKTTDTNNVVSQEIINKGDLIWDNGLDHVDGWNVRGPTP